MLCVDRDPLYHGDAVEVLHRDPDGAFQVWKGRVLGRATRNWEGKVPEYAIDFAQEGTEPDPYDYGRHECDFVPEEAIQLQDGAFPPVRVRAN